ncbi:MAG: hypothetical protein HY830_10915 [Actinobacteria bacterium]|nr:hypothetical protein [Actinomycetota bacterium]
MSVWQIIGVALVVIGVGEYVLFRYLAPRRENIARRMPLLMANSAFNVVVGVALFVLL